MDIGGYPVVVTDTAGLRWTADSVERQGVDRAVANAKQADAAILVLDATDVIVDVKTQEVQMNDTACGNKLQNSPNNDSSDKTTGGSNIKNNLNSVLKNCSTDTRLLNFRDYLEQHFENAMDSNVHVKLSEMKWFINGHFIVLLNKIDLLTNSEHPHLPRDACAVSLTRGDGIDGALSALQNLCTRLCRSSEIEQEQPVLTAARHRIHITAALRELNKVLGISEYDDCNEKTTNSHIDEFIINLPPIPNKLPDNQPENQFVDNNNDGMNRVIDGGIALDEHVNLLLHEENLASAAHYLHQASRHLGHVTGHITTEHVLDQIFKEFCIGKWYK